MYPIFPFASMVAIGIIFRVLDGRNILTITIQAFFKESWVYVL